MALEEGLNVKLVLIPDKEDPDSFINKKGVSAFTDFIAANKKDFILFQLDIALKDAGDDTHKRSIVVNQIAETISKINKAEDFTKQEDYIRKSAQLLKIDESGLHNLVNKFIREKINKQEKKSFSIDIGYQESGTSTIPTSDEELINLLNEDELSEKAIVRSLLEFGLKEWEPGTTVADYILNNITEDELIDNRKLMEVIQTFKVWYDEGIEPTEKNFLYHEDQQMSALVVSIMEFPYEVSLGWKELYEMPVPTRDDTYKEEVFSTVNYLKLRKIKKLISINQRDLEEPHSVEEQLSLLQTHKHLKDLEVEMTRQMGTVILR
jgi:DNA primase